MKQTLVLINKRRESSFKASWLPPGVTPQGNKGNLVENKSLEPDCCLWCDVLCCLPSSLAVEP